VGLVWKTHCFSTLPHGGTICVSGETGRTGAEVEDGLCLTANELKARAIKTYSEKDLRRFVEKIPQLYKQKSTVFTDLALQMSLCKK